MSNLKTYTLKETWKDWEVVLEVNHDLLTTERATEINEFWGDSGYRLQMAGQDAVKAVIKLAAERFAYAFLEIGGGACNTAEAAELWTRDSLHDLEGWGGSEGDRLFGWCGIRLVSAYLDIELDLEFEEE